jgi:hypothetical protein
LDLPKSRYAVQLKEEKYLIWKFKQKWKLIGKVDTKWNIIILEFKTRNRKKKRRKLKIIANLIDAGKNLIKDVNSNVLLKKENLFDFISLHKLMHNNNRYFDSFHSRNFQFYSQLIERYRDYLNEQETTYLFLTSSYTERNNETSIFNRNVNEEKKKSRNNEQICLKENTYNHFSNQENLTEECPIYSNHLAQPQEQYLHEEGNEPFNLHGETIRRPPHSHFIDIIGTIFISINSQYNL